MLTDKRLKELMVSVGTSNSTSLLQALRQAVMEQELQDKERIQQLEERIHETQEIYAGMEGFIPRNAEAAYTLRIIKQMYDALQETDK